jgi:hypothetical protein
MRKTLMLLIMAVLLAVLCTGSAQAQSNNTATPVLQVGCPAEPLPVVGPVPENMVPETIPQSTVVAMAPPTETLSPPAISQTPELDTKKFLDFTGAALAYGYSFKTKEDLTILKASFALGQRKFGSMDISATADLVAVGDDPANLSFKSFKGGVGASLNFGDPDKSFGIGFAIVREQGFIVDVTLLRKNI